MRRYNPDRAIFGIITGDFKGQDTIISYANKSSEMIFGDVAGRTLISLIEEMMDDERETRKAYIQLEKEGQIVLEGKINGKYVQFHSYLNREEGHVQAAIIDTTKSKRAQMGFEWGVEAFARAVEGKEEGTGRHIIRINYFSGKLASLMGLSDDFIDSISLLAQLHDVGKINVPKEYLIKPGRLSSEEFNEVKKHTVYGAKIIRGPRHHTPEVEMAYQIALYHHEQWAGGGYPKRLHGEVIPTSARIVGLVDVFDALASARPYKPKYPEDEVKRIMEFGDERLNPKKHFDPNIHETFLKNYDLFSSMHNKMRG